jgi:hypothetical protein
VEVPEKSKGWVRDALSLVEVPIDEALNASESLPQPLLKLFSGCTPDAFRTVPLPNSPVSATPVSLIAAATHCEQLFCEPTKRAKSGSDVTCAAEHRFLGSTFNSVSKRGVILEATADEEELALFTSPKAWYFPEVIRKTNSPRLRPSNGFLKVQSSYKITPRLQTSHGGP